MSVQSHPSSSVWLFSRRADFWLACGGASLGLLAAVMLGLGRAIGETMAALLATGNTRMIPGALNGTGYTGDTMAGGMTAWTRAGLPTT